MFLNRFIYRESFKKKVQTYQLGKHKEKVSLAALSIFILFCLYLSNYSFAEGAYKPLYKPLHQPQYQVPVINGEYVGTLYIYGVPISVIMSISGDDYGLGHNFTFRAVQDDLFIIGGNCDCLESGAILAEYGLYSECLGIDMGLMDQVELAGWFTDIGYSGELKLYAAGSQVSIPSLVGLFTLERR